MDLIVKFQGVKCNFAKVQGCFCKNTELWGFSEFNELFLN
jgi:hypothetical protein